MRTLYVDRGRVLVVATLHRPLWPAGPARHAHPGLPPAAQSGNVKLATTVAITSSEGRARPSVSAEGHQKPLFGYPCAPRSHPRWPVPGPAKVRRTRLGRSARDQANVLEVGTFKSIGGNAPPAFGIKSHSRHRKSCCESQHDRRTTGNLELSMSVKERHHET